MTTNDQHISEQDLLHITERLGREPRGLRAIAWRNHLGLPGVIRVSSVVGDAPFPTMYWLIDKDICYWLDGLEATGKIAEMQQAIDESEALQQELTINHQDYIHKREQYLSDEERAWLVERDYLRPLNKRGIGGIANFQRVRCFHTHYGAHLVSPNIVGKWLDKHYPINDQWSFSE